MHGPLNIKIIDPIIVTHASASVVKYGSNIWSLATVNACGPI